MPIVYPTRCEIIDPEGETIISGIHAKTPEVSKPHIGKQGTARRHLLGVEITLDDGTILMGYECWWKPI